VWRRRYLELTADGILKYHEAQEEDGGLTSSGTASINVKQGRPEESEKEWEDVAESCYEKNSTSAGSMTTTKSSVRCMASGGSIGEVERMHHHQPKPRAILLILRARLLNPSLPKDAKSGLPPNKFGFLFHGHILYYDNSTMTAEPDSTTTANNNISGSCTSTTSSSGVGNILSLYSSRPFHCAVSRQIDAIRWVRALQSVAVSNSMGFASILPPRYAPLKELESEDLRNTTEASGAEPPSIMEARSYEVSFNRTWEESLFDPLNIVSPLMVQASGKKNIVEGTNPAATSCCCDDVRRSNEGTEEGKNEPLQHPTSERGSSSFAEMNPMMRFCATLKVNARTWSTKLCGQPKDQHLWSSPYLCALGVAFWCGALLQKRISKTTPSLFANTRQESVGSVRADAAALGIAFAFIFGYRIGIYCVISDPTRQAAHFTTSSGPNAPVKVVEKVTIDQTKEEVHEVSEETHYREPDDASHEEEEPMLLSPLHPYNGTINSWSEPEASIFKVRGTSYFVDRVKVPSGPAAFPCRGVEIWLADNPLRHIARHPSILGGKLGEVDTFLVNFLLPFGNFVSYFTMTADCDLPVHVQEAWSKFRKGDQQYRDARLKLLPLVIEGPWIVKTVVGNGSAPALLGKVVPLQYFFTETTPTCKSVFEVDVIISASNIAKGILNVVKGNTKHLTLAFAIIIEAAETSELPECVLCAFQVHSLHLDLCPRLTECDIDCM